MTWPIAGGFLISKIALERAAATLRDGVARFGDSRNGDKGRSLIGTRGTRSRDSEGFSSIILIAGASRKVFCSILLFSTDEILVGDNVNETFFSEIEQNVQLHRMCLVAFTGFVSVK